MFDDPFMAAYLVMSFFQTLHISETSVMRSTMKWIRGTSI